MHRLPDGACFNGSIINNALDQLPWELVHLCFYVLNMTIGANYSGIQLKYVIPFSVRDISPVHMI